MRKTTSLTAVSVLRCPSIGKKIKETTSLTTILGTWRVLTVSGEDMYLVTQPSIDCHHMTCK